MKPSEFDASVSDRTIVTQEILGRRPSLNLLNFYAGRMKAHDEVQTVLRSYLRKDESLNQKQNKEMVRREKSLASEIVTQKREPRNSEILAAFKQALIPFSVASPPKAAASDKS
jgi:hypothetical protein